MVPSATVATINIDVAGESDSMSKKTKILIEPPAFIHIIQTDKPIYKPGQTGMSPPLSRLPDRSEASALSALASLRCSRIRLRWQKLA